ncbi:NUDIX hydrolase [Terrimonas sp.]|uniref:NUDIX hydrolase n=1 Tax=Terrimonas sp. TaxID=1914338 RepID=UPI001F0C8D1F|nr:NUDIX domain-containing protein [Terrimonas sp.]
MKLNYYSHKNKMLVAVDCIIFGFDGSQLNVLLIKRGFEPERGKWSLMGGFVHKDETAEAAAARVLKILTGLSDVYMEQLHAFTDINRDPIERTISLVFSSLIDINQYKEQLSDDYEAHWFPINEMPQLIFDHQKMVEMAKQKLRYKAAFHPIVFELLPEKFTLPQLQILYEGIYNQLMDKRNFSRKILSTGLLVKQKDKEKASSKRGAFYFKLDKRKYQAKLNAFLNFIPNPDNLN